MAYRRKSSARRSPVRRTARGPARRSGVRRAPARRASRRAASPRVVKIVIEHSTQAGEGMGGMAMPQITTQSKKSRF